MAAGRARSLATTRHAPPRARLERARLTRERRYTTRTDAAAADTRCPEGRVSRVCVRESRDGGRHWDARPEMGGGVESSDGYVQVWEGPGDG